MTNEFEEFGITDEDATTPAPFVQDPAKQDELISRADVGVAYDWSKAPDTVKAPPRVDLNGKQVTITKMEIVLPPQAREWSKTRDGKNEYKYCTFTLFYDQANQQESFSGMRVFKREGGKYSEPTFPRDGVSQVSRLLKLYADFKGIEMAEVKLREFYIFLNSKPKAIIRSEIVKNPKTMETFKKNMIDKFVK